jgi:carboxyl-terminal processing protease
MPRRTISYPAVRRTLSLVLCAALLLTFGGVIGYRVGQNAGPSTTVPDGIRNALNPRKNSTVDAINFGLFWQSWNAIDDTFYGDKDPKKRLDGAIRGMVAAAGDPYTVYFSPDENKLFESNLQGSFGGIGAELLTKNNAPTIVGILPGTPAEKSGLKVDDIIVQVDDFKTTGQALDTVVNHIRGEKGADTSLQIARQGQDQLMTIKVTRDTIVVKSVSTSKLGPDKDIAYIKVNQFGEDTAGLMRDALTSDQNSKGIIIDLRNNPGGYLQSAVDITGMLIPQQSSSDNQFLKDRVAVRERDRTGKENLDKSTSPAIVPTTKIIVLVNANSASAAEILSGALKDYGRATLLGTKTFGKGSAQTLTPLSNGGSIKITGEKWFTPLGTSIDHQGITPDVIVELPQDVQPSTDDAQVQKALQLLTSN